MSRLINRSGKFVWRHTALHVAQLSDRCKLEDIYCILYLKRHPIRLVLLVLCVFGRVRRAIPCWNICLSFSWQGESSCSRSGRDLVFRNERSGSLSFLRLSTGEGYRLRHWSLVAEEKVVGGTPIFSNELIFWLPSVVLLFSSSPGFWDLIECTPEQETPASTFGLSRTATQTPGMISC